MDIQPLLETFSTAALGKMMGDTPLVRIESDELTSVVAFVKDVLGYTFLLDITAVDNLDRSHPTSTRFELNYLFRHQ